MEKRIYEVLVALDTGLASSDLDALLEKLKSLVSEAKGEVKSVEKPGVRRLAFKVKGRSECQFCAFAYQAPSAVVKQIEQVLRLHEGVVRYMTTRLNSSPAVRPAAPEARAIPFASPAPATAAAPSAPIASSAPVPRSSAEPEA